MISILQKEQDSTSTLATLENKKKQKPITVKILMPSPYQKTKPQIS